jgi:hypothetical protein
MIHLDDDQKDFIREYAFVAFIVMCFIVLASIAITAIGMLIDWLFK